MISDLSSRFILSVCGIVLIAFAFLYGVHKITGPDAGDQTTAVVSERAGANVSRRSSERSKESRQPGVRSTAGGLGLIQAKNADEQAILDVVSQGRKDVAEQQRLQREKMAPFMEERRAFFASLEEVEDDQEKSNLRAEWMSSQREKRVALMQAGDLDSAGVSQRHAGMGAQLQRLRGYDLIPQLKPKSNEVRSLMVKYIKLHKSGEDPANNDALWKQMEQGMWDLRTQHQELINPERGR